MKLRDARYEPLVGTNLYEEGGSAVLPLFLLLQHLELRGGGGPDHRIILQMA
jgi:hypothetical protein